MLEERAHLHPDTFSENVAMAPTRDGFGKGVVEAGKEDERVVVLCADLKESTRAEEFEHAFPNRFVEVGVAEQNMASLASGMAAVGKIPFIASYAMFNPGRNYEQIRTTIALNQVPVKVCGMHAGVSVGPDGATHQMLEDIALMRVVPHMTVLAPGDALEAEKAVRAAAKTDGPVYIRFGRSATPVFTTPDTPFEIGKALLTWDSPVPRVAIIGTGSLTHTALLVARALHEKGVDAVVLHVPTIKPLDEPAVRDVATRARRVVTLEEHQIAGGFGSAIAEYVSAVCPTPILRLGIADVFGESGTPEELLKHHGLDAQSVTSAVEQFISAT